MVRRTKEEAQETRDEILNAASLVFCDKGFANASLEDIAKTANVTRGAIYWHFKNKTDIFEALHYQFRCPLIKLLTENLKTDHPSPIEQLQENCTNLLLDLIRNDHQKRIIKLFMQKSDYTGELACCKEAHNESKAAHLKGFSDYFEKAKTKCPRIQNLNTEELAISISCYMKGIIIEFLNDPELIKLEKRAPVLMEMYFKGLKD